jgi:hypothetical protein
VEPRGGCHWPPRSLLFRVRRPAGRYCCTSADPALRVHRSGTNRPRPWLNRRVLTRPLPGEFRVASPCLTQVVCVSAVSSRQFVNAIVLIITRRLLRSRRQTERSV